MQKKIELSQKWIQFLSELPEHGMGYQRVKVILKNGVVLANRIVLNSTYLVLKEGENINLNDVQDVQIEPE